MDGLVSGDGSVGWWIFRGGPGGAPDQSAGFRGIEFTVGKRSGLELPPGFLGFRHYTERAAPLRRNIDTDDAGNAAVFLCSDLARNVTGEILHVDSGFNTLGMWELPEAAGPA